MTKVLTLCSWLPIANKLFFNDSVMVHKCLNGRAPDFSVKNLQGD